MDEVATKLIAKLQAENLQLRHGNAALRERVKELEAMPIEGLRELAYQYRSDMRHPPAPDSRERRIKAINAVIGSD